MEGEKVKKTGAGGNMECGFFRIRITFAVPAMESPGAFPTYMSLIKN
jgi:hypothetical protein